MRKIGSQPDIKETPMRSLLVLASTILLSAPAFGQAVSTADQVRALDKLQREGALRGDSTFEEQYTASDYVSINPAGVLSTREQTLARMKSGNVKLDSIDVEQEEVHDYGDVAVITGRERVRGSYKGQAFDHTARYSRVWIRREGAWKLALFQETPLPQPGG
jgi:hypothetical protein